MHPYEVYYHGTDLFFDIKDFKTKTESVNTSIFDLKLETVRYGIFLTPSKQFAKEYGENVIPLKTSVKNPADVSVERFEFIDSLDAFSDRDMWLLAKYIPDYDLWGYFEGELGARFVAFLKGKGYDSAFFEETLPEDATKAGIELTSDTLVVFDAKNIEECPECEMYS